MVAWDLTADSDDRNITVRHGAYRQPTSDNRVQSKHKMKATVEYTQALLDKLCSGVAEHPVSQ